MKDSARRLVVGYARTDPVGAQRSRFATSRARSRKILGDSGGQPITQADVERMADEAERGYGDDQLRHVGRGRPALGSGPAKAVQARLDPELHAALERRAKADHKTSSEIVRDALHEYLSA